MTWTYAYTPQIWPSVLMVMLLISLSIYSERRRSVPGATPLMIACLIAAAWSAASILEAAAVDLALKIFWFKVQASVSAPIIVAITCFVLEYAWPRRWLTLRNLVLLSFPALLGVVMILTNDLHHLAWRGYILKDGAVAPLNGPGSWLLTIYALGVLGIVNLIVFGWLFLRSPQHRWPVVLMLVGQYTGHMLFVVYRAGFHQSPLPLDQIGMSFEFLMYAIALFGFRIFDPVSLARQAVTAQMHEGMLVLDLQGRVVSLNPYAERFLGVVAHQVKGKPVRDVLKAYPEGYLDENEDAEIEFSHASAPGAHGGSDGEQPIRHFTLAISKLEDWRGLAVGRLLMLHDVTAQRQAQALLVEQQRALAMLQEREQLARELHDSLGQVFAFVNTQGQTIRRLLSRGDLATADEYTSRLVEVAREADVDIRESILGLRVALSGQGFFPVLAQYLAQYEKNYAIHTELEKPDTMVDGAFEPLVEVQLLRILQEALTNIRKHAGAHRVRISFVSEDGCGRITVQDDGQGFDPQARSDSFGEHVGLRVMRERAEEVGGHLLVVSTPGQGTQVMVEVPVNSKR